MRRRTVTVAWCLVAMFAFLILAKAFVADVYRVRSGSMCPTLFGGEPDDFSERVLVSYEREPQPRRFDPVVMRSRDGGNPIIKRVVGLPGESVAISDGDLLIAGRRLPPDSPRPAPVVLFDDRLLDVTRFFHFKHELWTQDAETWSVDAKDVPRGSDQGMMFFHKELRDGYIDHSNRRVTGYEQVNDGILECEARLEPPSAGGIRGMLRFQLLEAGDTFQARILPEQGGFRLQVTRMNSKTLERSSPEPRVDVLYDEPVDFEAGRWTRIKFSNVDNHLAFELDGAVLASMSYEANVVFPGLTGTSDKSIGPRVGFGSEGGSVSFRSIVILRDLYYTDQGTQAVSSFLSLGPSEYFLLGDNASHSSDSRHFGPVRRSEILGRPIAVVWPPSRLRWIEGPGAE